MDEGRSQKWRSGFKRYFATSQIVSLTHSRLHLFLGIVQTLQFASLLLPLTDEWEIPWDYSTFWPCWYGLQIAVRVDQLLILIFAELKSVVNFCIGVFGMRAISAAASLLLYRFMQEERYRAVLIQGKSAHWMRRIATVDSALCLLFSHVLCVPVLVLFSEALSCSHSFRCLERESATGALATTCFPFIVAGMIYDKMTTCDLKWTREAHSMSRPDHCFVLFLLDFLTCTSTSVLSFSRWKFRALALTVLLGCAKLRYVLRELPYHNQVYNEIAAFQGGLLIAQSALIATAVLLDNSGLMPSLSLFLVAPMLWFVLQSAIEKRLQRLRRKHSATQWQELAMREAVLSGDCDALSPRSIGMWTHTSSVTQLLWSAYYYLAKKDFFSLKLLTAQLSQKRSNLVSGLWVDVCLLRVQLSLDSDAEEKVIRDFVSLINLQETTNLQDLDFTMKLKQFYEALLYKQASFQTLAADAQTLSESMLRTLRMYKKVLTNFRQKQSLLSSYCGFLHILGQSSTVPAIQASTYYTQVSQPRQTRIIEGVKSLQYDSPDELSLVVRCAAPCAIVWAANTEVLGYSAEGIVGMEFQEILPQVVRGRFQRTLATIAEMRKIPEAFNTKKTVYFLSQSGFLVSGLWRVLVTNLQASGALALIAILRVKRVSKEFAVISQNNELLEQTLGFSQFLKETNFMNTVDYACRKLWVGSWRTRSVYIARDQVALDGTSAVPVLCIYKQKSQSALLQSSVLTLSSLSLRSIDFLAAQQPANAESKPIEKTTSSPLPSLGERAKPSYPKERPSRPYFKMLLASVMALYSLCLALNVALVKEVNSQNYLLNQDIGEMQALRMRTNSVVSSMRSKELYLLSQGYKVFTNENKSRTDLENIGDQLSQMAGSLMAGADREEGRFRSLLLKPTLPFWRYEFSTFRLYRLSLIDIMQELARRAKYLASTPLPDITTADSNFMTLYRNGAVEAMHAFNRSVQVFAEQKDQERAQMGLRLRGIMLSFLVLQATLSICLTLPLLLLVEQWRRRLWTDILRKPRRLFAHTLRQVCARLTTLRSSEYLEASSPGSEADVSASISSYSTSGSMKKLLCAISLFILFINSSVYCMYYIGITQNESILVDKPKYIHWSGLRRVLPWLTMFNMREAYLPWNLSFAAIVKEAEKPFSPFMQWKQSIDELTYLHRCLTYGCSDGNLHELFPSNEYKELLLGTACTNCTAYARYGLTPLVHEFVYGGLAAFSSFQSSNSSYSLGKTLEKEVSTLGPALLTAVGVYDNETLSLLVKAERTMEVVCAGFAAVGLLLLAAVVAPLIWIVLAI